MNKLKSINTLAILFFSLNLSVDALLAQTQEAVATNTTVWPIDADLIEQEKARLDTSDAVVVEYHDQPLIYDTQNTFVTSTEGIKVFKESEKISGESHFLEQSSCLNRDSLVRGTDNLATQIELIKSSDPISNCEQGGFEVYVTSNHQGYKERVCWKPKVANYCINLVTLDYEEARTACNNDPFEASETSIAYSGLKLMIEEEAKEDGQKNTRSVYLCRHN